MDNLKNETRLAYQQLLDIGLGKYSRGIVSVISRETGTIIFKSAKATIVTNLADDCLEMQQHITIYRSFPTISAIAQPYAKYATVFAQIGADIPLLGRFHEDYFLNDIPCVSSIGDLNQTFYDRKIDPNQTPAVLLLHQGAFAWGGTLKEAVNNAGYLEEAASLAYLSLQIDPGILPYK